MAARKSVLTRYLARALASLLVLTCVFIVAGALWTRSTTRTHRIRYRLKPWEGGVTPARLERTRDVLADRLASMAEMLRLRGGDVRTIGRDLVEVEISCQDDPTAALAWLTMPARVEFRLLYAGLDAAARASAEPEEYETKVYRTQRYDLVRAPEMEQVEEDYLVEREPVLRIGDFERVQMDTVGLHRTIILTFRLGEPNAEAFAAATALHVGREMAMLVDGEMFFPPKTIESAVTAGSVQAQGYFYTTPLKKLVCVLNSGGLPGRLEPVSPEDG